jgi:hypothetical protein
MRPPRRPLFQPLLSLDLRALKNTNNPSKDHSFSGMATPATARWMTEMAGDIGDRNVTELAILGTHDSATYGITHESGYAVDAPTGIPGLPQFLQATAKHITAEWAKTQAHTVLEQLRLGVRYLDIRLSSRSDGRGTVSLWVSHGLYSVPFSDVVRDVVAFINGGAGGDVAQATDANREVFVLDVQKIWGFDRNPSMHALFLEAIAPLELAVVRRPHGIHTPLAALWAAGQRVFVLYPGSSACDVHPGLIRRGDATIRSWWFNLNSVAPLVSSVRGELELRRRAVGAGIDSRSVSPAAPGPADVSGLAASAAAPQPLHVTQGVMTPVPHDFAKTLLSPLPSTHRSIAHYAFAVNAALLAAWQEHEAVDAPAGAAADGRNILILDFFTVGAAGSAGAVALCIAINRRRFCHDHPDFAGDALMACGAGKRFASAGCRPTPDGMYLLLPRDAPHMALCATSPAEPLALSSNADIGRPELRWLVLEEPAGMISISPAAAPQLVAYGEVANAVTLAPRGESGLARWRLCDAGGGFFAVQHCIEQVAWEARGDAIAVANVNGDSAQHFFFVRVL